MVLSYTDTVWHWIGSFEIKAERMVHVERYQPENLRNGRSRGPSPNGHNVSPDTSDDDCKFSVQFISFNDIWSIRLGR